MDNCLLFLRFQHGSVTYNEDFTVTMEGRLYPRDLAVAHETIQRYKENSKHSRELLKKYEQVGE